MATLEDLKIKEKMGIALTEDEAAKLKQHRINISGQKARAKQRRVAVAIQLMKDGKFGEDQNIPVEFRGQPYSKYINKWKAFERLHGNLTKQEIFMIAVSQSDDSNQKVLEEAEAKLLNQVISLLTEKGKKEWATAKIKNGNQRSLQSFLNFLGKRMGGNLIKGGK
jgi:hypothetical protein